MKRWLAGARPRTLAAAVVPVAVGTGLAAGDGRLIVWRALAALVVALAIQVATNYANDYADGLRGADHARVGPVRLVASGLATPSKVRCAAWLAFGVAAGAGLLLAAAVSWWLVPVGAACIAAGWLYTGGPRPYGYAGLGEAFVFAFFGLVATAGTAYVEEERLTLAMVFASVPVGLLATALLVANNLRDIPSDTAVGKRTLAVRLGDSATRRLYIGCVTGGVAGALLLVLIGRTGAVLAVVAAPLAIFAAQTVARGALGRELVPVLVQTARVQLAVGVLLALGLWLW